MTTAEQQVQDMKAAAAQYAAGEISAGKLAEVLGVDDVHGFRSSLNTEDQREIRRLQEEVRELKEDIVDCERQIRRLSLTADT